MGDGFSTQPDELRTDARTNLGEVVEAMEDSKKALRGTDKHTDLFQGGGELFAAIETYWSDTRYYLERVLNDNMENLRLAEEAVVEIADRYEADDQRMAEILKRVDP